MKALDDEIFKTKLKKTIIKQDIEAQANSIRSILKPATLGWQLIRMVTSKNSDSAPSSVLLRSVMEIITTAEASKYGFKLLKKIFS
jgi:hypothetical protein